MAAMAGFVLVLSGCFWPAPGAGPDRNAHNPFEDKITPATVADLEEVWRSPTPGAAGDPVTSAGAVHVPAGRGMYAFDQTTGSELWVRQHPDLPDFAVTGPATVAGDVLWTGAGIGNLGGHYVTELLDPATGVVVGTPGPTGFVDSVRGDRYLLRHVGFGSGGPVGLSVTVGDLQDPDAGWSGTLDVQDSGGGWSPLTLGDEYVFQAGQGVLEINPATRGNGVRGYSVDALADCPPDFPDLLICPTWTTELQGTTATSPVLSPDGSMLYTMTDTGYYYAIDTSNGEIAWFGSVVGGTPTEPALADNTLYFVGGNDILFAHDVRGGVQWTGRTSGEVRVQPAVAGGLVFTGSTDGVVEAFDVAGCDDPRLCDPVWSASAGAAITGAPAVSGGQIYVGTSDGVVAYGLPAGD